ncbi:MAG: zinc-ribbon domain-containing protein [Candidatus Heimdallarchaeaceae archaeon]
MDTATNILFRSLNAIYESTISSGSFYPSLYFIEKKKKNTYFGFRLNGIIPSRLIINLHEDGKNIVFDMLWLVDDSKTRGNSFVHYYKKTQQIVIDSLDKSLLKILKHDASLNACFDDLREIKHFPFEILVANKKFISKDSFKNFYLKFNNIPTQLFAFSRFILEKNRIKNEFYQDESINGILAMIDLIHRTLELLNKFSPQTESKDNVFCVRCGQKIPEDSYYCPLCGTKQK